MDADIFPNIAAALRVMGTWGVTSCEAERSVSVLRGLVTYLRSTMGQERTSSLALMHIHYDQQVNMDRVMDLFAREFPRRLRFIL